MSFDSKKRVAAMLKTQSGDVPAGCYEFAIYQWRFHGIKDDLVLQPVASTEAVTAQLSRLLEKATDLTAEDQKEVDKTSWGALDAQHYNLWAAAGRSIGKGPRN
jgi:hypothetical protein